MVLGSVFGASTTPIPFNPQVILLLSLHHSMLLLSNHTSEARATASNRLISFCLFISMDRDQWVQNDCKPDQRIVRDILNCSLSQDNERSIDPIRIERSLSIHSPILSKQYQVIRFNWAVRYPSTIHSNPIHEEWTISLIHFPRIWLFFVSLIQFSSHNHKKSLRMCDGSLFPYDDDSPFIHSHSKDDSVRIGIEPFKRDSESQWFYSMCIHSWPTTGFQNVISE